jgi:hypothetical protein
MQNLSIFFPCTYLSLSNGGGWLEGYLDFNVFSVADSSLDAA